MEVRLGNQTQEEEKARSWSLRRDALGPIMWHLLLQAPGPCGTSSPQGWAEAPRPAAVAWKDGRVQPLVEEAVSSLPPLGHPPLS